MASGPAQHISTSFEPPGSQPHTQEIFLGGLDGRAGLVIPATLPRPVRGCADRGRKNWGEWSPFCDLSLRRPSAVPGTQVCLFKSSEKLFSPCHMGNKGLRGREDGGTRSVCQGHRQGGSRKQGTGQASGKRAQHARVPQPRLQLKQSLLLQAGPESNNKRQWTDEGVSTVIPATRPGHESKVHSASNPFLALQSQQQGTLWLSRSQHGRRRPPLLTLSSFPHLFGPLPGNPSLTLHLGSSGP